MGRKGRQPFHSGLSLHADGDRLQLLGKFACGLIFGLLPLKQPVPEEAKRPGPLVQTASLLARGIEPRLPADNDHATSSFQRRRPALSANKLASRACFFWPRHFQRKQTSCRYRSVVLIENQCPTPMTARLSVALKLSAVLTG